VNKILRWYGVPALRLTMPLTFFFFLVVVSVFGLQNAVLAQEKPLDDEQMAALAASGQPEEFNFIVLGDVHGVFDVMSKIMEQSKADKPAFAVQIGDLFAGMENSDEAFKAYVSAIRNSGIPCFTVMGNHDCHAGSRDRFHKHLGAEDYSFDYGPVRIIVMDTSRRWMSTAQLAWLDEKLRTDKRAMIFTHMPPHAGDWWVNAFHGGSREFLRLCEERGVEQVFLGHVHILDWAEFGAVPMTCAGVAGIKAAFAPMGVPFRGYVKVRVTKDGSEVSAVAFDETGKGAGPARIIHPLKPRAGRTSAETGGGVKQQAGEKPAAKALRAIGSCPMGGKVNAEEAAKRAAGDARANLQDCIERYVAELMSKIIFESVKNVDPDGNETMEYVHTVSKAVAYALIDGAEIERTWTEERKGVLRGDQKGEGSGAALTAAMASAACPLDAVWKETAKAAARLAMAPRTPDMALSPGPVFGKSMDAAMKALNAEIEARRGRKQE